jgi:hypothetical protein
VSKFVGVFLLAVLLHTLWDGVATLPAFAVIGAVSLLALGWATHRAAVVCERPDAVLFGTRTRAPQPQPRPRVVRAPLP